MGLIWTILIGLVIGVVAKFVHPGRDNLGIIMTIILGVAGSLVATFLGQAVGWYEPGQARRLHRRRARRGDAAVDLRAGARRHAGVSGRLSGC